MRRSLQIIIICFSFFLSTGTVCFSQPYWNEWINFQQKYYKMPIYSNGIYRLTPSQLSGAGIAISGIDVDKFQVFFRGQEQYIYVQDNNGDSFLNGADYIEFYGRKNDGSLEGIHYKGDLYNQPVSQANPYYSLFNDTSAYFLTWNSSSPNKRIQLVNDTVFSTAPTPTPYFMKEEIVEYHQTYYYGFTSSSKINYPHYHEAEGWASADFNQGTSHITTFNTSNLYPAGPPTTVKMAVMGESDASGNPDHIIRFRYKDAGGVYVTLDSPTFNGYLLYDSSYSIFSNTLGASTDIVVSALTGPFSTSRNAVPYVVLKYPHNLNLESKTSYELFVPENQQQSKSNFSFSNFNDLGSAVYVYDLTNYKKIPVIKSGGLFRALVANSPSPSEKFCVVKSEMEFLTPASILPVQGTGTFTNFSTLNADSAFILVTHKKLMAGATAYEGYRKSVAGGSHNVVVADIEDLYDQFGYGIPKYPFALRHFAEYCLDTFPTPPQNLFMIGKSVQPDLMRNANIDPTGVNYSNCLIPSIGYPTCDNMLVTVLNGSGLAPAIPIGRLAAKNNSEVNTYLTKINEYEHPVPNPDEWMKHVIHMGGGANASQQAQFAGYLKGYEAIIEDTLFGGFVHHFSKNSSSPTQTSFTDSIRGLINSGVSIITFFGHTSASVFEFNILPADEYENEDGKFPFFIADGCVAGDIHQPVQFGASSSESYTLSNRGVIAFAASSGPGTANELDLLTQYLYKGLGKHLYGRGIGKCLQAAIDSIDGNATNDLINAAALEMTLHGDPAVVVHSSKLPDYAVNTSSVFFEPTYVTTELDSFKMHIAVANIGRATQDSVKVNVRRIFTDGTFVSYSDTIPVLYYKDTITLTLPVDKAKGPGLNKFEVMVDSMDDVNELEDVLNNNLTGSNAVPLLIYSGDIVPVHPYEYAIVPDDTILLKAYTTNPFTASTQYIFEVDTTDLFNSGEKRTQLVTQAGAVVNAPFNKWQQGNLLLMDSTVYFWRVRRDHPDTVTYRWRESSFQYLKDKRGWGQSHFFQFLKGDHFSYIDTNRTTREFALDYQAHSLEVSTINFTAAGKGNHSSEIYFYMDGLLKTIFSSISSQANAASQPVPPHVLVSVIDPVTGLPWYNDGSGQYGSYPQGSAYRFEFKTSTPSQQETLRLFLSDTVPCGHKVILYVCDDHNLGDLVGGSSPTTNPGLIQAFQKLGGVQFSGIQNDLPYILIGRNCQATAKEVLGVSSTTRIFLTDTLSVKRTSGMIHSEVIGPASKWESLHWNSLSPEALSNPAMAAVDSIVLTLIGFKSNMSADTLIKVITRDSLDVFNLNQSFPASTYPYLQLQAWVEDTVLRTPEQLKFWRIYYEGVPDAALNPVQHFTFHDTIVQQGDSIKMSIAIENISEYDMDSIWVKFWVFDANRKFVPLDSMKMDSLPADSIVIPSIAFSTEKLPGGLSSLWVEANPFNSVHQLEQYHFNNIGSIPFTVGVDGINPMLDVTFDGVHIMNGDLVSAKPVINIRLKDENTFLALNDTSDFDVFLKHPGKTTYERVFFNGFNTMSFDPAVLPNNSCRISYNPALSDGTYEFRVQASDRSGNASGNAEYNISFEVINKPTITRVLNYPNPFSTSTKFVFTLTGSEVPDFFKIQILTVSGKIVRDLNKHELGPIHIGRNITEYAWDGKDQFGDQLANGLYLYRVITQLNGRSLEHRETDADSFFTQGYGKMYLIR